MDLGDAGRWQGGGEFLPVELGIVARPGHGSYIDQGDHAIVAEQRDKLGLRAGGVADGVHQQAQPVAGPEG